MISRLSRLVVLGMLASTTTDAGTLNVSPVRLELPTDGSPKIVRLRNPGAKATMIQVETFMWDDPADPQSGAPSPNILAVPPVFEVGPDSEQVIRLALRQPTGSPIEETYRLVITEVPSEVGEPDDGISFALQLNLPIFVTPEGAKPDPSWSIRPAGQSNELILTNRGSAPVRVRSIELSKSGATAPLLEIIQGGYVLAGEELSWPLDLPATPLDGPLTLKADTNVGPLETTVSWPEG